MARFRKLLIPLLVFLAAFSILISLGVWQVKRLYWKENLIATVEDRIKRNVVPFDHVLSSHSADEDVEYMPVELIGKFHHSGERHYFATLNGQSGWHVYTPLLLGKDSAVLVNRGFVPMTMKDASVRVQTLPEESVRIIGLARIPPVTKPNYFTPDNEPENNIFHWRDIDAMAMSADIPGNRKVIPLFIDAKRGLSNPYPIGGTTQLTFPNNHLQYAGTWFGLAVVLLAVFLAFARVRLNAGGNGTTGTY